MNTQQRVEIERQIVRHLIREANKDEWVCRIVDNGEGEEPVETEAEIMDEAFAADDARLFFRKVINDKGLTCWVYIVLGNDGFTVISNHSGTDQGGWNELMERLYDYAEKLQELGETA